MDNERCEELKLTTSSENKSIRSAAERVQIDNDIVLPQRRPCNFRRTKYLMTSLAEEYTQLGQYYQAIIESKTVELRNLKKEVDAINKATRLLEKKQAAQKRKLWCLFCQKRAKFVNAILNAAFCSQRCEELYIQNLDNFEPRNQ